MRLRDTDIQIHSLIELYEFLDTVALHLDYSWDFTEAISKLKQTTSDTSELAILSWELACFSFEFRGSDLFTLAHSYDPTSEVVQKYPSDKDFEEAGFKYIAGRVNEVENPLLKARYSHILWKAPKGIKNKKHGVAAIESYVATINALFDLKEGKSDEKYLQVSNHYESAIALCSEVNYENKEQILELTDGILYRRVVPFFLRHAVLDTMLKNPKYFKSEHFGRSLDVFKKELESVERVDYHLMVNYYLPTALKIAQKTKTDVRVWHNHTGDCYMRIAERETKEDRYWMKLEYYTQAIRSYGLAGNTERKKEVEQLYFELKPNVRLPEVEVKFDVTEVYKELGNQAERIIKLPAKSVYAVIMSGRGIFPSVERIKKQPKNHEYDFLNSVYRVDFDRNKNISGNKAHQDEPLINPYNWEIQVQTLPFLEFIFTKGIQSGKLTFENMIEFLRHHTWFGNPFTRIDLGGDPVIVNWIKLLAPSIVEYFIQTKSSLDNKFYFPDYTLCIDSLVLKLEGLLRNFCERLNLATNVIGKLGIQEANLNQVLEIEELKKYFDEDDFTLFKYLLVNEGGINLRNNVAHCFYTQDDYKRSKMHLLLAAMLRIGKYNLKPRE